MGKTVRYEFVGSRLVFLLYCVTLIGIPFDLEEDPSAFLEQWRERTRRA